MSKDDAATMVSQLYQIQSLLLAILKDKEATTKDDAEDLKKKLEAKLELEEERARAGDEIEATAAVVRELRDREDSMRAASASVEMQRERLALEAAKAQRMARRFQDLSAGRYQTTVAQEVLAAEMEKAQRRREKLTAAVEHICDATPHFEPELTRALTLLSI